MACRQAEDEWRHICAGTVLLLYYTGSLIRNFCHRGLSIKNNNCGRWGKNGLITNSAGKKTAMNGLFSIRPDSSVPWGVVENRGRSVDEEERLVEGKLNIGE